MRVSAFATAVAVAGCLGGSVMAQESLFDRFEAEEESNSIDREQQSEALRKFAEILNGSDRQRAMDAMEFMIANGDDEIYNYAVEHGVYSTDPRLQAAALRAVLDRKRQYRFEVAVQQAPEGREDAITNRMNGIFNAESNTGDFTITIDAYDSQEDCWPFDGYSNCAFIVTGTTVSFRDWSYINGSATLSEEGVLEGLVEDTPSGSQYTLRIPILE